MKESGSLNAINEVNIDCVPESGNKCAMHALKDYYKSKEEVERDKIVLSKDSFAITFRSWNEYYEYLKSYKESANLYYPKVIPRGYPPGSWCYINVRIDEFGENVQELGIYQYLPFIGRERLMVERGMDRFVPEGCTEDPEDKRSFLLSIARQLHGGMSVADEDWKMFLKVVVGAMRHWDKRQDAKVRLCDCGFFVHQCFGKEIPDDIFEDRAYVDGGDFVHIANDLLADFKLSTGRCVGSRDEKLDIYKMIHALVSRSENVPIAHRIVSLKVLCAHLNVNHAFVRSLIDMTRQMALEDVFALPVCVVPEFIDEMITGFTENVQVVIDFFSSVGMGISDMLTEVVGYLRNAVVAGKAWVGDALAGMVEDALQRRIGELAERVKANVLAVIRHPMFTVMWKTMIRWWMGYRLSHIALELILDGGFTSVVAGFFSSFIQQERNVVEPEALDRSVILVIFVTLFMGMLFTLNPKIGSIDGKFLHSLCKNMSDAANAMDKLKVKEGIADVVEYLCGVQLGDEERSRFRVLYPSTMAFLDAHVLYTAISTPTKGDEMKFRQAYVQYYAERVGTWNAKDFQRLNAITMIAQRAAIQLGASGDFKTRRQPDFYLFYGPPGCGKSTLSMMIAKGIAKMDLKMMDQSLRDEMELIYAFDKNDQYFSGYANQSLWIIEEFLQKMDVAGMPARDVSVLYNLCTTTPLMLNMASVEDKGTIGRAYLVIGSSNVDFSRAKSPGEVMKPYIKSFVEPAAIARRISHYVLPLLRDPYYYDEKACKILKKTGDTMERVSNTNYIDPVELYHFEIKEASGELLISPSGQKTWSYVELLVEMWKSYVRVKNFCPEDSVEGKVTVDILDAYVANAKMKDKADDQEIKAESGWGMGATLLASAFTAWYTDSKAASMAAGMAVFKLTSDIKMCNCGKEDFAFYNAPDECLNCFLGCCKEAGDRFELNCLKETGECLYVIEEGIAVEYDTSSPIYVRDQKMHRYCTAGVPCWLVSVSDHPKSDTVRNWKGIDHAIFNAFNAPGAEFGLAKVLSYVNTVKERMRDDAGVLRGTKKYKRETFFHKGRQGIYLNVELVYQPLRVRHFSADPSTAQLVNWITLPLIGAIVGAGVCNAVRWLKSSVIVTEKGEARYDAEAGLVVDLKEGERVLLAGRWYVQKKTKDGFKLYPEGGDVPNELLEAVDVPTRLASALPSIQKSLFAVVDEGDALVGNIFAINSSQFLCPLHVARTLERKHGLMLKRDSFVRSICGNTSDMRNVIVHQIGEGDLAVVEFLSTQTPIQLESCRRHISKFLEDDAPQVGYARLCYRNHRGELVYSEGVYTKPDYASAQYVINENGADVLYDTPARRIREWDGPTQNGFCGALYLDMSSSAETPILGIHVARDRKRSRAIMHNVFARDFKNLERVGIPIGNVPVVLTPESHTSEFLNKCGLFDVGEGERRRVSEESTKERSWLFDAVESKYDLAPLKPFVSEDGQLVDPWSVALKKLGVKSLEHIRIDDGVLLVAREIGEHYAQFYEQRATPDWPAVFSTECGLPSIRRKKAAGSQFRHIGACKGITCVKDEEVPIPKEEWVSLLIRLECRLAPEDWHRGVDGLLQYVARCDACLKDEPRLIPKCKAGKTRLFTSVPVHEFLLERKFFSNLVGQITEKNILFNSALGLSPADFNSVHEYMAEAGEDCVVLAFDYEHMDGSVKLWMVRLIALITHLIMSKREGYKIDPDFPPFDKDDFIRYRLLMRLGCFVLSVFDANVNIGSMHPSGSFLTCYINHMVQMVSLVWVFRQILGPEVDILNVFKFILLGDDSLIAIPRKYASLIDLSRVRVLAQRLGFKLTGSTHEEVLESYPLWVRSPIHSDYIFLGRRFCEVEGKIVGMLEPERVEKTLAFVAKKNAIETFPQQMMAVFDELVLFRKSNDVLYLKSYEKLRRVLDDVELGFCDWALDKVELGEHADVLTKCVRYTMRRLKNTEYMVAQAGETTEQLGGNSQGDTTTFVSNVVEDVDSSVLLEDLNLADPGMEIAKHTESDAFLRPFKITSFVWDATTAANPVNLYLPSAFFNGYPNAQFKLANFAFLRGVMCIRVIISSTPYSAGKLLLSCRPLGPLALTPYQASGDICSEIDAASGATAEIKIATTLPQRWSNVEMYDPDVVGPNVDFDWCCVQLFVASALAQVGVGSVNVSIYGWIEEGELRGPTLTDFTLAPQGLSEQASLTAGFVEKKVVPMVKTIGGLMTECAAVMKTVATVAAFAGLSKPAMLNNTVVQIHNSNYDGPHMFGTSPGIKMCCSQQQRGVMPEKIFNFSEDQLDIPTFCSRPGLARIFKWNATDAAEDVVGVWRVNPGVCSGGVGVYNHTPMSYVAGAFRLWRGTLFFRLALAKTRFHSGTLEVVWQMGLAQVSIVTDYQATNCYRAIWDVQESSEFEIEVPYVGNLPWSSTMIENDSNGGPTKFCPTGFLSIRVVNPLGTALGQVTDSVDVLLYAYGGRDIEFAIPCVYAISLDPPVAMERNYGDMRVNRDLEPQVGGGVFQEDKTAEKESVSAPLKMAQAAPPDIGSEISCIGEKVGNLRLLFKRMSFPAPISSPAAGADLILVPWFSLYDNQSFVEYFSKAFAFFSGGVVIQANYYTAAGTSADYFYCHLKWCGVTLPGLPVVPFVLQDGTAQTFEVPYQNIAPFVPMAMLSTTDGSKILPYTFIIKPGANTTTPKFLFSFGAGDDFTMGWQIGPPALGSSNSSSTNQPQYNNYY